MKKRAFTLIEIIFVIVILGVLSAIAIPKLFFTRGDAIVANARTQIAAIKSGISLKYNDSVLKGTPKYPDTLESPGNNLFNKVISVNIADSGTKNGWHKTGATTYTFKLDGQTANFTYDKDTGEFDCTSSDGLCSALE